MGIDLSSRILFEDENLVVLNKPAGISVTPGPGNPFEKTIAGWFLEYIGQQLKQVGQEDRWGIVHRLDKDTSGVLLMPKTGSIFEHLQEKFRSGQVKKTYIALAWGDILATLSRKRATHEVRGEFAIDAPIDRHPKGFSRFLVSPDGKEAVTEFSVMQVLYIGDREGILPVTLLNAYPKTGRTHQIRVHLKAFGHPIVGDVLYQSRTQYAISQRYIDRQFLHAQAIEFEDLQGNIRRYEASLPDNLSELLEKLQ